MNNTVNAPYYREHITRIYNFLDFYDLATATENLWELMQEAMQSENVDNWDGLRRANALFFYQQTKELIESVYWLAIPLLEHFGHELPPGIHDIMPKCLNCYKIESKIP